MFIDLLFRVHLPMCLIHQQYNQIQFEKLGATKLSKYCDCSKLKQFLDKPTHRLLLDLQKSKNDVFLKSHCITPLPNIENNNEEAPNRENLQESSELLSARNVIVEDLER